MQLHLLLMVTFAAAGAAPRDPAKAILDAACRGDATRVRELLPSANRAAIDGTLNARATPLTCALKHGHVEVVRALLDAHADPNLPAGIGDPLILALEEGLPEAKSVVLVRWLLDAKAEPGMLTRHEPLDLAVRRKSVESARLLLERGAPAAGLGGSCDAMRVAVDQDHSDLVKLLLEHGGDCGGRRRDYETWLTYACSSGKEASIRIFLAHGADVNAGATPDRTPLLAYLRFAKEVDLATVELLSSKGAKLGPVTKEGYGPCAAAVERSDLRVLEWLANKGADIHGQCDRSISSLRDVSTAEFLIAHGCALANAGPALQSAASDFDPRLLRWLLAHGVPPDPPGSQGETPLHRAVRSGSVQAAEALLQAGADPLRKDEEGKNAFDLGKESNWRGMPELMARVEAEHAAAEPVQAIILGGGKVAADAEATLGRYRAEAQALAAVATSPEGFPAIRRSDDIPGLKPGFHVVLLGFCPKSRIEDAVGVFRAFFPGTYARTVDVKPDLKACPALAARKRVERSVAAGNGAALTVTVLAGNAKLTARAVLNVKNGALLDAKTVDPSLELVPAGPDCELELKPSGAAIVLRRSCPYQETGAWAYAPSTRTWRFSARDGAIVIDSRQQGGERRECAEGACAPF